MLIAAYWVMNFSPLSVMLKLRTIQLDEEAREWFRKLKTADEEALALWQWFRDELVEFNRLYNKLQVELIQQ